MKFYLNYNENWNHRSQLDLDWNDANSLEEKKLISFKTKAIFYEIFNGRVINSNTQEFIIVEEQEFIDYLINELVNIADKKLILRHYIILWNSKYKERFFYAKKAIDLLIDLIPKERGANEIVSLLSNYIEMTISTNYKKKCLGNIISNFYRNNEIESYSKLECLPLLLENRYFKGDFLKTLTKHLEKCCDDYILQRNIFYVESLKDQFEKFSGKIGEKPDFWFSKCAMIYENYAECKLKDIRPILSYEYFIKAKGVYAQANNSEGVNRVSVQIELLKNRKLLDRVPTHFENKKTLLSIVESFKNKADKLLLKSTKEILDYIIYDDDLFPSLNNISTDSTTKFYKELAFKTIELDNNKNTFGRNEISAIRLRVEEESKYRQILKYTTIEFLNRLFNLGTQNGKLSYEYILIYLNKYSWLSKEFSFTTSDGIVLKYVWLELLNQQIKSFFSKVNSD